MATEIIYLSPTQVQYILFKIRLYKLENPHLNDKIIKDFEASSIDSIIKVYEMLRQTHLELFINLDTTNLKLIGFEKHLLEYIFRLVEMNPFNKKEIKENKVIMRMALKKDKESKENDHGTF